MDKHEIANALLASTTKNIINEANDFIEKYRLKKLRDLDIIDKQIENDFKDFVLIAAKLCDTKTSLINLVDDLHQVIKAKIGYDGPVVGPKDDSVCGIITVKKDDLVIIPDALKEPEIANISWVKKGLVRFYAGAPLIVDKAVIGSLCVFDEHSPKILDETQKDVLRALARLVSSMLTKIK